MTNYKIEMSETKIILDACCGSRMFWFDKENPLILFADIRDEEHTLCDGRSLKVHPDIVSDFTDMPFLDKSFKLVVFDPPHLLKVGQNSWLAKKYGKLPEAITLKPFSVSLPCWYKSVGILLFWLSMTIYVLGEHTKGYKEGFDTGIKQCIKILDRNCHSKEINNDETVQNQ